MRGGFDREVSAGVDRWISAHLSDQCAQAIRDFEAWSAVVRKPAVARKGRGGSSVRPLSVAVPIVQLSPGSRSMPVSVHSGLAGNGIAPGCGRGLARPPWLRRPLPTRCRRRALCDRRP